MAAILAHKLLEHPRLKPIPRDVVYRNHPRNVDKGYVPAVHHGPLGTSIYMYPFTTRGGHHGSYGYKDRVLPDGQTIEYHPSTNTIVNVDLNALVGQVVTLYAQCSRTDCRTGKVLVKRAPEHDVYHLVIQQQAPVAHVTTTSWADMD